MVLGYSFLSLLWFVDPEQRYEKLWDQEHQQEEERKLRVDMFVDEASS